MALITATEVTIYSSISASAATIVASGLIPIIQDKITMLTNNYFLTDLYLQDTVTFNATARTIIATGNKYSDWNFLANDDIFVYGSYRNDGYFTIQTVSDYTLTLISGQSVIDELSGKSVMITVCKWPREIKQIAALMIEYDLETRGSVKANVKSRTMGPFSESYSTGQEDDYGYPTKITDGLVKYRIARVM